MKKNLLYLFVMLLFVSTYAQDSLIMYSGKHYKGKVSDFNNNETLFRIQIQKKNKIKSKVLPKEDVFAIYYKDSISQILYTPLITDQQPLTIEEMKSFISGENLAMYRYRSPWAIAAGSVTGAALFNLGMWGMLVPAAYVGVVAAVSVKPTKKKYFPADKVNDTYFIDGFKQVAKRKKIINAAIGGAASTLLVGTIVAIWTFRNYND